jgi:hypothetical protein
VKPAEVEIQNPDMESLRYRVREFETESSRGLRIEDEHGRLYFVL